MAGKNFDAFKDTIEREFMGHPVVKKNDTPPGLRTATCRSITCVSSRFSFPCSRTSFCSPR